MIIEGIELMEIPEFTGYYISKCGRVWSEPNARRGYGAWITGKYDKDGYHTVGIRNVERNRKHLRVHRIVALVYVSGKTEGRQQVNHIDGNKINNYYTNLEWCNNTENRRHSVEAGLASNGTKRCNNTSGYVGVIYMKNTGKWRAQITSNGKMHYSQATTDILEAAEAYDDLSLIYHVNAAGVHIGKLNLPKLN